MKIKLDENLPTSLARMLAALGRDVDKGLSETPRSVGALEDGSPSQSRISH